MTVLLVDWLGRGGIAQATSAWAEQASAAGRDVFVATRPGRELTTDVSQSSGPRVVMTGSIGALAAHDRLARATERAILDLRPSTVIVQNYVLPPLEWRVHRAARGVGAEVVVVVHDHRMHAALAGMRVGLRRCLRSADGVLAHSRFVADEVEAFAGRAVRVVPLPLPVSVLAADRPGDVLPKVDRPTAVHFGILTRGYKGVDMVIALVAAMPDWRFAFLGTGAPIVAGAVSISGFLPSGEFASGIEEADVALLPYHFATQSGAVTLAQALGTVPVVTAVGGIPEQVDDGVSGILLPRSASLADWRDALDRLADDGTRAALAVGGKARVHAGNDLFASYVRALLG